MFMSSLSLRRRVGEMTVVLIIVAALGAFLRPVFVEASGDRNRVCVENAQAISTAIGFYYQDYDDRLPPANIWNDTIAFQTEIGLYTDKQNVFRCPATGRGYIQNPSLAGVLLSGFTDWEIVKQFEDSRVHADGKKTVMYLDGHAERGGIYLCSTIQWYANDHNNTMPPLGSIDELKNALAPYFVDNTVFDPPIFGSTPFVLNTSLSNKRLESLPANTIWIKDVNVYAGRFFTVGYTDGYARRVGPGEIP